MSLSNEKSGWGGHPNRTDRHSAFNTKRISSDRREIKAFRVDREAERLRLLRLHAGIRFNDLGRLIAYRRRYGLNVGSEFSWAVVLANLSEALGTTADVYAIHDLGRRLGLPEIDPDIAAAACRSGDGLLLSAVVVGEFLEVSSCERTDARLRNIEAVDESAVDRKRRIARERQRRRRHVTRPNNGGKRDTGRKTGGGSRRFASRLAKGRASTSLPSLQEPQPFSFFPHGESKGRTTARPLRPKAEFLSRRDRAGSKSETTIITRGALPASPRIRWSDREETCT